MHSIVHSILRSIVQILVCNHTFFVQILLYRFYCADSVLQILYHRTDDVIFIHLCAPLCIPFCASLCGFSLGFLCRFSFVIVHLLCKFYHMDFIVRILSCGFYHLLHLCELSCGFNCQLVTIPNIL